LPTSRLTEDVWGFTYTLNDFLGSDFNQRGSGVRRWDGLSGPEAVEMELEGVARAALDLGLGGAGGDAAGKIWGVRRTRMGSVR